MEHHPPRDHSHRDESRRYSHIRYAEVQFHSVSGYRSEPFSILLAFAIFWADVDPRSVHYLSVSTVIASWQSESGDYSPIPFAEFCWASEREYPMRP